MPYECEYTDTFGGEANYSWVRVAEVKDPVCETGNAVSKRRLGTLFKRALNITGMPGRTRCKNRKQLLQPLAQPPS